MSTLWQRRRWVTLGLAIALGSVAVPTTAFADSETRLMNPAPPPIAQTPSPEPIADNLLVSIRREGGFCIAPGCFSEVAIFKDGTYRYSTHDSDAVTGRISEVKVERLQNRINRVEADDLYVQPLMPQPIDNFCGLAFDGPEVVYMFPKDGQVEEVRGCDFAINPEHSLVQKFERLYERISQRAIQS